MHTILCTDRRYPSSLMPGRKGVYEPGVYKDDWGEFSVSGVFIHLDGFPSVAYLFTDKREALDYYNREIARFGEENDEGVHVELIIYN